MKYLICIILVLSSLSPFAQDSTTFYFKKDICQQYNDTVVCADSSLVIIDLDTNFNLESLIDTLKKMPVYSVHAYFVNQPRYAGLVKHGSVSQQNKVLRRKNGKFEYKYENGSISIFKFGDQSFPVHILEYENGILKEEIIRNDSLFVILKFDHQGLRHGKFKYYTRTDKLMRIEKYRHGKLIRIQDLSNRP